MITAVVGVLLCSSVNSYNFEGGTGDADNPFKISTAAQLIQIGADPDLLAKSYILENDIDLDPALPGGRVFSGAVISTSFDDQCENADDSRLAIVQGQAVAVFRGRFSGNGHSIRNMVIDAPDGVCIGLFAYIGDDGVVDGLKIEDSCVLGQRHVGLLAGINQGTVSQCGVSGSASGRSRIGGLIGSSSGHVICSESRARVAGENMIGGLTGHALSRSSITGCSSSCDVSGRSNTGGLVGEMLSGILINCHTSGKVISSTNAGGIIGGGPYGGTVSMCGSSALVRGTVVGGISGMAQHAEIENSYAASVLVEVKPTESRGGQLVYSGGLVGYWRASHGHIVHCCWDEDVSGAKTAVGSIEPSADLRLTLTNGVHTAEMKAAQDLISRVTGR